MANKLLAQSGSAVLARHAFACVRDIVVRVQSQKCQPLIHAQFLTTNGARVCGHAHYECA